MVSIGFSDSTEGTVGSGLRSIAPQRIPAAVKLKAKQHGTSLKAYFLGNLRTRPQPATLMRRPSAWLAANSWLLFGYQPLAWNQYTPLARTSRYFSATGSRLHCHELGLQLMRDPSPHTCIRAFLHGQFSSTAQIHHRNLIVAKGLHITHQRSLAPLRTPNSGRHSGKTDLGCAVDFSHEAPGTNDIVTEKVWLGLRFQGWTSKAGPLNGYRRDANLFVQPNTITHPHKLVEPFLPIRSIRRDQLPP